MIVVSPISRSAHRATRTVTVAGVPWPVYKLEALALGLAVAAALLLITGSAQFAVLTAAVIVAARWIAGRRIGRRSPRFPTHPPVAYNSLVNTARSAPGPS